ncbi:MAG: acyltransferase family protein [Gammaproteobacteria bacterium]
MRYRSDIDGLRALAVIPVVLFHAGYDWIPGGFVGVDVFFVISGYLISSIISREMAQGVFTFRGFYERRLRRIIPALLIVLFATLLVGYFLLLPDEYITLSESTASALGFVPNIYFFATASTYFGLDIVTAPLLHTWSLGIEEQFYLFFPVIVFLLYKYKKQGWIIPVIAALFIASILANILFAGVQTKFTFYMLPTRAWELLAGVLLSLGFLPEVRNKLFANLISMAGLVLILGAMLALDETAIFPGVNAIYPVLGAVFIIYANTHRETVVSRLLSNKVFVWIGLISYSLYLWHWPVTVYTKLIWDSPLSQLFVVCVSVLLAAISYHYIESRYRKRERKISILRTLKELGFASIVISMAAAAIYFNGGLMDRVPDAVNSIAYKKNYGGDIKNCEPFIEGNDRANLCQLGNPKAPPEFVVWGDSHAIAISPALDEAARELGVSGYTMTSGGCRALLGVYRKSKDRCLKFNNQAMSFIKANPSIKVVFLVGYWRLPLLGESYDNSNFLIIDEQTKFSSPAENRRVFERGLHRTLAALTGYKVVVVEDIPEIGSQFGKAIANHLARETWLGRNTFTYRVFHDEADAYSKAFLEITENLPEGSDYIKIKPQLCNGLECKLIIDGELVYADGDHLSGYGAQLLKPMFKDYLRENFGSFLIIN